MDPADDDTISGEKALSITKKMFIGGFLFLPWLWLCNFLFYREYLSNKPQYPPQIRRFAFFSLVGFCIEAVVFVVWYVLYMVNRKSWGASGDAISLLIPQGE
eukprot:TRINITY_DN20204_c0_g1_i1.p1 TRINITY_DN20204_c0_g1~~TRINITY_DN20204_c0_g1_i1.p1  ORF type:complete len:102 (+),score=4.89 TRINITY_DN20204_c0_g1_i1:122-427(+)